jgi:protein TonB
MSPKAMTEQTSLWLGAPSRTSSTWLFVSSLILAAALHVILLLAVGFEVPDAQPTARTVRPLEVLVLRRPAPTDVVPEEADAYAQVNREGGGMDSDRTVTDERPVEEVAELPPPPSAALPVPEPPAPPDTAAEPKAMEAASDQMLTATIEEPEPEEPLPPERQEPMQEPDPLPAAPPTPPVTTAQIIASRSLEIAKLTAKIEAETSAYANRPRRKAISASTQEYKYASYLETWRRKVEQVGNLNYPEEAKRRRLYGNLILHVALRSDGSLEDVRVLRSSGFEVLDEAAVRIVELAAPYAPFPPNIKAETDILDITRTWRFLSNYRLGWEN